MIIVAGHKLARGFAAALSTFLICVTLAYAEQNKITSDEALIAMGLCEDMVVMINRVVDYTSTKCVPAFSSKGTNFIFVSKELVFSVQASKKAWIIFVVASVGRTLNDKPSYSADQILFADVSMVPDMKYYSIPAGLAKSLQHDVFNGNLTLDDMWDKISAALKPVPVDARH